MKTPKKPTTTVKIYTGSRKELTPAEKKALVDLTGKPLKEAEKEAVRLTTKPTAPKIKTPAPKKR